MSRKNISRLIACLVMCVMCQTGIATAKVVYLGADIWCPYNCDPESDKPGYLIELAEQVFNAHGFEVHYQIMPWARALKDAKSGNIDAAIGIVEGNVEGHLIGRQKLGRDETVLVVRKGETFPYRGPSSFISKRIGVITNYTYDNHGAIDRYIQANTGWPHRIITVFNDTPLDSLFAMLQARRIDAFFENSNVAAFNAKRLKVAAAVEVMDLKIGDNIFFGFTPDARGKALADILDNGVLRLRQTGALSRILLKYGLSDWE